MCWDSIFSQLSKSEIVLLTLLNRTLTHEIFHRVQLCPIDSVQKSKKKIEFEDIVSYAFPINNDTKFYEALSYIFLEGSSSFVGGMDSSELTI